MYKCPKCGKQQPNKAKAFAHCELIEKPMIEAEKPIIETPIEKPMVQEVKEKVEKIIEPEKELEIEEEDIKEELTETQKEMGTPIFILILLLLLVAGVIILFHEKAITFFQNLFPQKEVKDGNERMRQNNE